VRTNIAQTLQYEVGWPYARITGMKDEAALNLYLSQTSLFHDLMQRLRSMGEDSDASEYCGNIVSWLERAKTSLSPDN
jgi:hypothetical protein